MRSVLMLCHAFPPSTGAASLRAAHFARSLPEHGWQPFVVTLGTGWKAPDEGLPCPEALVARTPAIQIHARRAVSGSPPGRCDGQRAGLEETLRRFARRWLYFPDAEIGWAPFALAAGRKAIRDRRFDVVLSTSYPVTAHVVARHLATEARLPWVAEFRDFWTDWSTEVGFRKARERRLESSLLRTAAAVVVTSPTAERLFKARGAERVATVTAGFEPPLAPVAPLSREPFVVAYLGTYYPGYQDLRTAWSALGQLRRDNVLPQLALRFVGTNLDPLWGELQAESLDGLVDRRGWVSNEAAQREIRAASLLLLGGPPDVESDAQRGLMPAKVFEYLGARRPILMIGHPDSDVGRLVSTFSHARTAACGDVSGARRAVTELLSAAADADGEKLNGYTWQESTRRLADVLTGVCCHLGESPRQRIASHDA